MAERLGFKAVYLSGGALSAAAGVPDVGLLSLNDFTDFARSISLATSLPLLCDADTGFGEALNVERTVQLFERAGAAGIHLEDQVLPKRCGHLSGKGLVEPEVMVAKIRAAVAGRQDRDFVIIARTDGRGVSGFDVAIRRAQLYLEAGADAIFPEALENEAEFAAFARAVTAPLLANNTEFGKSPNLDVATFAKLGYAMVLFPLTAFRSALKAAQQTLADIAAKGHQRERLPSMLTARSYMTSLATRPTRRATAPISARFLINPYSNTGNLMSPSEAYSPGLEGVVAGETAISTVEGGLRYRGYPVTELSERCSFDEVAYLLLHGELPSKSELASFQKRVAAARTIPDTLRGLLKSLPKETVPMDALRSAVSILAHYDPDVNDNSRAANLRKAERLLGQIPVAIAEQYRAMRGLAAVPPRNDLGHAANFLNMLRGTPPSADDTKAFDVSLILYAEHEYNASTFTAHVVVSTESDLHSGIVAAIGALKGPLHGGANEKVMDLLLQTGGPKTAEQWIKDALARKVKIMGFGHRVYKAGDVRAKILKEYARKAAAAAKTTQWEDAAEIFEQVLEREKGLFPNLDWPAGRLYHSMGLEIPLYTPFFVASRVTGWSAHIMEQLEKNRLIRPRAKYTGPPVRAVQPLAERS